MICAGNIGEQRDRGSNADNIGRTCSVQNVIQKANLNAQCSTTPKENNNTIPNKIITRITADKKYCINITIHIFLIIVWSVTLSKDTTSYCLSADGCTDK